MAWLRIDDGYDTNSKLLELTEAERWRWTRVLIHCAKHRTEGRVTVAVIKEIGLGRALSRLTQIRLLDETDDPKKYLVHDWDQYNPKDVGAAQRMRRRRQTIPTVQGGQWERARQAVFKRDQGICFDCGKDCSTPSSDGRDVWNADHDPSRDVLIEAGKSIYDIEFIFTRCHSCHAKKTRREATDRANDERTDTEPQTEHDRYSRVGTRARPVPSPTPTHSEARTEPALPALELQALPQYEGHEYQLWKRLTVAAGVATKPDGIHKLENVMKAHGSTERELVMAIEAATGPGVKDPLAVALAELKKLGLERKQQKAVA